MSNSPSDSSNNPPVYAPSSWGVSDVAVGLAAAVLLPAMLAGCGGGGGGGGGGDTSPTLTITAIEVATVTNPVDAAVTVNNRAKPATTGITLALDGSPGLLPDPGRKGASSSRALLVHVTDGTTDLDITVTFNPTPTAVGALMGSVFSQAHHLAARTGFGGSWDDLLALMGVPYATAVDTIVDQMRTTPVQSPPSWINSTILTSAEYNALSQTAKDAYNDAKWPRRNELKQWWLREIVKTSNPLTERMIAFWGNHFVVNIDDIEEPQVAWSWLSLLRTHVGGNLRTLLHAVCLHPAMLIYLDNASNVKARSPGVTTGPYTIPSNENFGRELLELFTLGEGYIYGESDVIAVARAFTGHNLGDRKVYLFKSDKHDPAADLVILNSAPGAFGGTDGNVYDIVDLILGARVSGGQPPRFAQLVVEKLWTEFIGITPPSGQVDVLAQLLVDGGWELKPLYKALFKHSEFIAGASDASRKLLKMPLEHIAGFYRSLGLTPKEGHWDWRVYDAGDEDQDPLCPPNVKGWLGGTTWINTKTLIGRFQHDTNYGWDLTSLTDAGLPSNLREGMEQFLLNVTRIFPATTPPSWDTNPFAYLLRELLKDPAYQIK